MAVTLNEKNLRFYLALDFDAAEIARLLDVSEKDVAERLARIQRKDEKLAAAGPVSLEILRESTQQIRRGKIRPYPPEQMQHPDRTPERFSGAHDVRDWMTRTFIDRGGKLYNPDHQHLLDAKIGVLWTNVENSRAGRMVAGTAEKPALQGSRWTKRRSEMYLELLLGGTVDFLITLDSVYAAECDDAAFCALCEHELYHCGHAVDNYGSPRYSMTTGAPIFAMRGHDCEEFVGVVRRYGVGAAAGGTAELVEAAQGRPAALKSAISGACGTCRR